MSTNDGPAAAMGRIARPVASCFGAGLALTYVALWAIATIWSRASPRQTLLRALATTATVAVLLVLLELPAMVGLVSYGSILEATAITDAFVADAELSFRGPSGHLEQLWPESRPGDGPRILHRAARKAIMPLSGRALQGGDRCVIDVRRRY